MSDFISVHTATQERLPDPCPQCSWWQGAGGDAGDLYHRLAWMEQVERAWGPPGLMLVEGEETLAAIQFAPVDALPRVSLLPPAEPPDEGVLAFCLRARLGAPVHEPVRLLQRTMFELRRRGTRRLYAYARPLGTDSMCGLRNVFGFEFLSRHGFTVVSSDGDFYLMRADLLGLMLVLKELKGFLPRWAEAAGTPSPAIWSRREGWREAPRRG